MSDIQKYGIALEIRDSLKKLKQYQKTVNQFNRSNEKALKRQQQIIAKGEAKATKEKVKSEKTKLKAAEQSIKKEERLRRQAAAKQQKFEEWKTRQFRSAAFDRLTLEQKMEMKRILNSKKSEKEIRDEFAKTTAKYRRELKRRNAIEKNKKSVKSGGISGAVSDLKASPMAAAVLSIGTATVAVGTMILSGQQQFKDTKQGAGLVGMDYNEFSELANGLMAVTEFRDVGTVADKIKDLQDRAGETMKETVLNKETGTFEKGEGSILANFLKERGAVSNKDELTRFMNQDPKQFIESIAKLTEGMNVKEQAFILEAFGSDFQNIIRGIQTNTAEYEAGKQGAITFDERGLVAAERFSAAINKLKNVFSNMDVGIFSSFTDNLSDESLEMFGRIGDVFKGLIAIVGNLASILINTLSPFLNLIIAAFNGIVEAVKISIKNFDEFVMRVSNLSGQILDPFEQMFDGIRKFIAGIGESISKIWAMVPDFMKPDDQKSTPETLYNPAGSTPTPYNATPPPSSNRYEGSQQVVIQNHVTVISELDGQKVGQSVMNSEAASSEIDTRVSGYIMGNR